MSARSKNWSRQATAPEATKGSPTPKFRLWRNATFPKLAGREADSTPAASRRSFFSLHSRKQESTKGMAAARPNQLPIESDSKSDAWPAAPGKGKGKKGVHLKTANPKGDSGNSDNSDQEGDDSPAPETPRTAEVRSTEEPLSLFHYRTDGLDQKEKEWFEKIKMYGPVDDQIDATDDNNETQNALRPTDTFGQLQFKGDVERTWEFPAWFIRMDVKTPPSVIGELFEKHEVLNKQSRPLHIHCIDYNLMPPGDDGAPDVPEAAVRKLQKDVKSLCEKTAGIILTWSGLSKSNLVHATLRGLMKESSHNQNFAAIATPPWGAVDPDIKEKIKVKGGRVDIETQAIRNHQDSLGTDVSQYASHFLLLDDPKSTEGWLQYDAQWSNYRHFHYHMIEAMQNYESKKDGREAPVVCILFNGHHDALKMVLEALKKKIPVLVVQGSGGYADVIAEVYTRAKLQSIKERDEETGRVRTRQRKQPGWIGEKYMRDPKYKHSLLREIYTYLDDLTVYNVKGATSSHDSVIAPSLDSVVFEALLKHKQEDQFSGLVEIMQKAKLARQHQEATETRIFIDSADLQMDYFLVALKQKSVKLVKVFLNRLDISSKFMEHFNMALVLRLYAQDTGEQRMLIDVRKELQSLLTKLTVFPLRCIVEGCPNCDRATNSVSEAALRNERTCLHPMQELFLWTLLEESADLAVLFWDHCDDKIAAALVAQKVFHRLGKKKDDPDEKWQLVQYAEEFQRLAVDTLRSCHNMDEIETEALLTKPCPWWGDVSVLQLAIMTDNRKFMTQTACTNIMTRIWEGMPPSDEERAKRFKRCKLVDDDTDAGCCANSFSCSPLCKYRINSVLQAVFLALFSFALLSDLGQGMTTIFMVLIVWVLSITFEELRQLLAQDPVLNNRNSARSNPSLRMKSKPKGYWAGKWNRFRRKWKAYWTQNWNRLDMTTIVLFWFGMLVFSSKHELHVAGRILLSLDIFFFYMRVFQMLMVYNELGIMLVMVYKMVKDTRNFMIILLNFVLAYAIASESLLYPESDFTWLRVYHLPRKAFWQVFGELSLEEIEPADPSSCSYNNGSQPSGFDPLCPTKYGSYIVPVLLGIHIMITNVLLLNLLIARFGVTFTKVHEDACEYQAWHRCQIITEYYSRTSLPPPFNVIYGVLMACRYLLSRLWHCCRRCCRASACCRRKSPQTPDQVALNALNQDGQAAGQENQYKLTVRQSADRRSLEVSWSSSMPADKLLDISQPGSQASVKLYTVQVTANDDPTATPGAVSEEFTVIRKQGGNDSSRQAFTLWNCNPCYNYSVKVAGFEATTCPSANRESERQQGESADEAIRDLLLFEEEQARWVRDQQEADTKNPIHEELKKRTDALKLDVQKIPELMKERNDAVRKDVDQIKEKLVACHLSVSKNSEKTKSALRKIKDLDAFLREWKQSHSLQEAAEREVKEAVLPNREMRLTKQQAVGDKEIMGQERERGVTAVEDRGEVQVGREETMAREEIRTTGELVGQVETLRQVVEEEVRGLRQQQGKLEDFIRDQQRQHDQQMNNLLSQISLLTEAVTPKVKGSEG